jgi:hypothetical protein
MEEEYSPKRGMETGIENILNGGARNGIVPPVNPYPVDIPVCYDKIRVNNNEHESLPQS